MVGRYFRSNYFNPIIQVCDGSKKSLPQIANLSTTHQPKFIQNKTRLSMFLCVNEKELEIVITPLNLSF